MYESPELEIRSLLKSNFHLFALPSVDFQNIQIPVKLFQELKPLRTVSFKSPFNSGIVQLILAVNI